MSRNLTLTLTLLLLLAFAAIAPNAHAQGGRGDDYVLYPQPVLPIFIGPEAGYAWWKADASFVVNDGSLACAAFADGEGEGPAFGMRSFVYLTRWIALSPRLRYEPRLLDFTGPLDPEPARDERDSVVMLTREGQAQATVSTFTLDLRLAVDLFGSGFYLSGGPAVNMMGSGFYDYSERITGPAGFVQARSGESSAVLASGRSFERQETVAFDLRGGAGLVVTLGRWAINPEASYTLPLTSSLGTPDTMKQRGVSVSLGVLYNFGDSR